MENFVNNNEKMLGTRVSAEVVGKFTNYCQDKGFKRNILIPKLINWWMDLPESIQWLIYRGKFDEAKEHIAEAASAHKIVSQAKARAAKQKQKGSRKPSKSA